MTGLRPAEVESAFAYREQVQAMMMDPDLTGDTLLLGIGMAHRCQLARETGRKFRRYVQVCEDLGWENTGYLFKLRRAVEADIPRYEIERLRVLLCEAPMIRREGTCDKQVQSSLILCDRDPQTGAGRMVGFCSRHGALQHDVRARMKAWRENECPEPPHNTGGVLRRYFTGLESLYKWANNGQDITPGEGKPPSPPRPTLTLIAGGAA